MANKITDKRLIKPNYKIYEKTTVLGLVLFIVGLIMLVLFLALFIISLFQRKNKKPVVETPAEPTAYAATIKPTVATLA